MRRLMSGAGAASAEAQDVLEHVELPVEHAAVALASGRRVEVSVAGEQDRITVRNRDGAISSSGRPSV